MDHDDIIHYDSDGHAHSNDHGNIYTDCGYRHRVLLLVRHDNKSHNRLQHTDYQHNKDNESPNYFDKNLDRVSDYSNDTSHLLRNTIDYAN
jgi:hypothetical protein